MQIIRKRDGNGWVINICNCSRHINMNVENVLKIGGGEGSCMIKKSLTSFIYLKRTITIYYYKIYQLFIKRKKKRGRNYAIKKRKILRKLNIKLNNIIYK